MLMELAGTHPSEWHTDAAKVNPLPVEQPLVTPPIPETARRPDPGQGVVV